MSEGMHEVVKLLIARMKSHPEEFRHGASRWVWMVNDAMDHGSAEECAALKEALRPIRLREVHEHVMDELCNGDERRRKEEEERKYYLQQAAGAQQYANVSQSLLGQPGQFITDYDHATQTMRIKDTHTKQITSVSADSGMFATIKKALGV